MAQLTNGNGRFNAVDRVAIDFQAKAARADVFQRLVNNEIGAVNECLQTYGDMIWTIAKSRTASVSGAEQLTQEIFSCIWRSARNFDQKFYSERGFVLFVIRQCVREWESMKRDGTAVSRAELLSSVT